MGEQRGTFMRVGCPKEIKNHEYRVGLTPDAVRDYVAHGHDVLVETMAGAGIGADDASYSAAGARIDPRSRASGPDFFELYRVREGNRLHE